MGPIVPSPVEENKIGGSPAQVTSEPPPRPPGCRPADPWRGCPPALLALSNVEGLVLLVPPEPSRSACPERSLGERSQRDLRTRRLPPRRSLAACPPALWQGSPEGREHSRRIGPARAWEGTTSKRSGFRKMPGLARQHSAKPARPLSGGRRSQATRTNLLGPFLIATRTRDVRPQVVEKRRDPIF
jgi:hypothetical protein